MRIVLIAFCCSKRADAQTSVFQSDTIPDVRLLTINPRTFQSADTVWVMSGICKTLLTNTYTGKKALPYLRQTQQRNPFLKVHGNIQYDFTYRSLVDTPFYQQGFSQHTLQTTFDITVKENYPVRVTLLTRQSNSPWFDDITDVNVQFNQRDYMQLLRNKLAAQLSAIAGKRKLPDLEKIYQQKLWEAEALNNWLSHPGRLQELVEEGEKNAAAKLTATARNIADSQGIALPSAMPGIPVIPEASLLRKKISEAAANRILQLKDSMDRKADSLLAKQAALKDSLPDKDLLSRYRKKKEELDKLQKEIKNYEGKLKSFRKTLQDSISLLKQQLSQIKDPAQLKQFIRDHQLDEQKLPKGWKTFSAINSIGIGRTWVDYSELTVKNISLTGINTEINSGKLYFAAAAGKINYRFRDFVLRNKEQSRQSLYLFRAGLGRKEGNHFIVTWYDGKRNLLNASVNSITVSSQTERVMGMSAEARLQINPNNQLVMETAKSSFHTTSSTAAPASELLHKVWNFNDHSNEAWSVKLISVWPQTNTRINGYYRKAGAHFQSFNLQPVNTEQVAYHFKVQQSFWKKRLTAEAGIRKNDFSSPYINPGINSKTVFKSLQATLRIPKYPFISVGYFPSSQLTVLDNDVIAENQYNTFTTVVSHAWRLKGIAMNSNAVYLRFFNQGADTGFVYYNASSISINQFVFLKNLQLQTGYTHTSNRELTVKTIEQSLTYQVKQWLSLSGGMKYNRVNSAETLWGGSAGLGLNLPKLGTIQVTYDRSYLPGTRSNLLPVDMGRVGYSRVF